MNSRGVGIECDGVLPVVAWQFGRMRHNRDHSADTGGRKLELELCLPDYTGLSANKLYHMGAVDLCCLDLEGTSEIAAGHPMRSRAYSKSHRNDRSEDSGRSFCHGDRDR